MTAGAPQGDLASPSNTRTEMSLRRRLLLFLLLPLIPLSAVLIMLIYWAIRSATTESYDRVLEGSALAIADRVVLESSTLVVDLPYAALQMLTNSAEDRVFYSVQKYPSGEVITGYRDLPAPDFGEGNGGEDRGLGLFVASKFDQQGVQFLDGVELGGTQAGDFTQEIDGVFRPLDRAAVEFGQGAQGRDAPRGRRLLDEEA